MPRFTSLAVDHPPDLLFGTCPTPLVTRSGLEFGAGTVYPEINFTLPAMPVDAANMPAVERVYREAIAGVLRRSAELEVPGLVVEFETLPPMTEHPGWAMAVVDVLLGAMAEAREAHGLRPVLRMTPTDVREFARPLEMRTGRYWEAMAELFDRSAAAGAELLSIESVGGKEIHDDALTLGDLPQVLLALCVLGTRDMRFLWTEIAAIAARHGVHAAGDTACGYGNTAMVLAHQKMIPRVFAAVVRAVSAVRSLVAYECGAVGPGKDCGYENIILKAITGLPMAGEGKSAACAHPSPVGNVAAAACDLWSNESVQHVRLLGGMAPVCSLENLVYDCRLMNRALADGPAGARRLRDWLVESDAPLDPQAWILRPDAAVRVARAIVAERDDYRAGRSAALEAIAILTEAHAAGRLRIDEREIPWLGRMRDSVGSLPDDEGAFIEMIAPTLDPARYAPAQYGL